MIGHEALPFPDGRNSAEAEAFAGASAVTLAVRLQAIHTFDEVEFEGDNAAVVGYWEGVSRYKGLRINGFLEQARDDALYRLGVHRWKYVPRECIGSADHLAGIARDLVHAAKCRDVEDDSLVHVQQLQPITNALGVGVSPTLFPEVVTDRQVWDTAVHDLVHATTFTLRELPSPTAWGYIAALLPLVPSRRKAISRYYAQLHFICKTPHVDVTYATDVSPRAGRMYPRSPSGLTVGRRAGLLLYGDTHVEIDMAGAHLSIFLMIIADAFPEFPPPPELASLQIARAYLEEQFQHTPLARLMPRYAKELWSIALNSERRVWHIMRIIMQANVVVPTRMRYLLTYIDDMCQRIMSFEDQATTLWI
jgi:hypothetical protein